MVLSILFCTLWGLVLAYFGLFGPVAFLLPVPVVILSSVFQEQLGAFLTRKFGISLGQDTSRSGKKAKTESRKFISFLIRRDMLWLLPVFILCCVMFMRPHEYMGGVNESAFNVDAGVHLARTGDMVFNLGSKIKSFGGSVENPELLEGFFVYDRQQGLAGLDCCWAQAVWNGFFYSIFGLGGVFLAGPLWALLSALLIFSLARNAIGRKWALMAMVLFGMNLVQIWFARSSYSVLLGQFFILAGMCFWQRYLHDKHQFDALWAGACFGVAGMTGVAGVVFCVFWGLYLVWRFKRRDLWALAPCCVLLVAKVFELMLYNYPAYGRFLAVCSSIDFVWGICAVGAAAGMLRGVVLLPEKKRRLFWRAFVLIACVGLLFGRYFVHTHFKAGEFYLWFGPVGALALVFAPIICLTFVRLGEGMKFFLLTGLLQGMFFLAGYGASSAYPLSLKPMLAVVVPVWAISFAAAGYALFVNLRLLAVNKKLSGLKNVLNSIRNFTQISLLRLARFLFLCVVLVSVFVPLLQARSIVINRDYARFSKFFKSVARHVDPEMLYLTDSSRLADIMSEFFGRRIKFVETGTDIVAAAQSHLDRDEDVGLLTMHKVGFDREVDFVPVFSAKFNTDVIVPSRKFPPQTATQHWTVSTFIAARVGQVSDLTDVVIDTANARIGLEDGFKQPFTDPDSGVRGRWTNGEGRIVIPWFGSDVAYKFEFELSGMPASAGYSGVDIVINGKTVERNITVPEKLDTYVFYVPPGRVSTTSEYRAEMLIKSNTFESFTTDGTSGQVLGVFVGPIKIKRVDHYTYAGKKLSRRH